MRKYLSLFAVIAISLLVIASLTFYTVDQRQSAIVFQLGEIVGVRTTPGLYAKIPFMQNIRFFDTRILTLDSDEPELFNTLEKQNVLVDSFVKWRIIDVKKFYVSVNQGNERQAADRLNQTVNDGLRAEFGRRTVAEVVSGQRNQIMENLRKSADIDARQIGVQVLDVRLKRVDFPEKVSDSVYGRMESERKREATRLRSTGSAESEKIRADADKQRQVILSEAFREAENLKGDGDAKASAIYAQAYTQNPEFYAFYRSMEAYRQGLKNKNDVLVLEPTSEFFKYFRSSKGAR